MATRILRENHPVERVLQQVEAVLSNNRLILYYDIGKSTLCLQNIDTGASYFLEETTMGEPVDALPRILESENLCHVTFKDSSGQ